MRKFIYLLPICLFLFSCSSENQESEGSLESDKDNLEDLSGTTALDFVKKETIEVNRKFSLMSNLDVTGELHSRHVMKIGINASNKIMVRDKILDDTDDLEWEVEKFYEMNQDLSGSAISEVMSNEYHRGYDYPFYFTYTADHLKKEIAQTHVQLKHTLTPFESDYFFKKLKSLDVLLDGFSILNQPTIKRLEPLAHIRVAIYDGASPKFIKETISQLEKSIVEIRNDVAEELFGTSYSMLYNSGVVYDEIEAYDRFLLINELVPNTIYCPQQSAEDVVAYLEKNREMEPARPIYQELIPMPPPIEEVMIEENEPEYPAIEIVEPPAIGDLKN